MNSSRTLLEDGEVLLLFKAAITSDPNNALKFWKRQGKRQVLNACRWVGVQCTKRRVTAVDLYNQSLQGAIDPSLGRLSNLISLDLSNNFLSGSLPAEFGTLKSLTSLNVYNNNLSDSIPASLGSLPALKTLNLSRNNFGGSIPPELGNDTALEALDLSGNDLVGALQMEFSQLRNLSLFNASSNRLSQGLPTTIGDLASLVSLDLSNNELGGTIPSTIGDLLQLQTLALADSLLIGTIPQEISNCVKLKDFRLNNNQLRGVVPVQLTGIQTLLILHLQNNSLEGSFVNTLGSLRNLEELDLSYNNLNGSVPAALGSLPLRSNLSLAHNSLTGPIPPELGGLGLVQSIDLSSNNLSGDIPQSLSGCVNLTKLDLSGNSLNGSIPKTLNSLSGLSLLNVSHNDLTGFLPRLGNMSNLKVLDASSNHLSGEIMPNCVNFATLSALNLSYNDFEGQVPPFRPHDGVTERSFLGNPNLCGDLLNRSCRNRRKGLSSAVIIGIVCGLGAVTLIALLILCCCCCKRIKGKRKSGKHSATVSAELQLKLTPEEILAATGGFNQANFLGAGSVSTVYRGVLRDETVVAVKRLAITTGDGKPECEILLDIEMETLGHIRHKSLVKVLGYCSSSEIKALVLEYMHNGNLDTLLYPPPHAEVVRLFDWYLRFDAAIGVAKGLKYLHHDCVHPIIHGDVKPSNILFDGRMEARISDFGVARILADQGLGQKVGPSASSSTAYGYTPPGENDVFLMTEFLRRLIWNCFINKKICGPFLSVLIQIYGGIAQRLRHQEFRPPRGTSTASVS